MSTSIHTSEHAGAVYVGLRMTAREFLELPDDGYRYELVNGVVIVSPSPTPKHQRIAGEVFRLLASYLEESDVGMALQDIDVVLEEGAAGGDLVYRPDIVFLRKDHLSRVREKIFGAPDLVVEVISPSSVRFDARTKKDDYERCGVLEYWLIDPQSETMTFHRLQQGRYVEAKPSGQSFASEAVPGFALDLPRVRNKFKPW